MTDLIAVYTITSTDSVGKRVLWSLSTDGLTSIAEGIQSFRTDSKFTPAELRDLSLCDAIQDSAHSICGRIEELDLAGGDLIIKLPSNRLIRMVNDFTSWGRSSAFKDESGKVLAECLDRIPMHVTAVTLTQADSVSLSNKPTQVESDFLFD